MGSTKSNDPFSVRNVARFFLLYGCAAILNGFANGVMKSLGARGDSDWVLGVLFGVMAYHMFLRHIIKD